MAVGFEITTNLKAYRQAINIPLTRGDWLSGMAKGLNALDRFTMAATSADAAYQDASGGHRLAHLGNWAPILTASPEGRRKAS